MATVVLASASPRRRDLLERLGVAARVRATDVDETPHPGETPDELVRRLAVDKATAGLAAAVEADVVVVAADTVVVLDHEALGKPSGPAEAAAMLRRLSGRSHLVMTGVAVAARHPGEVCGADHDLAAAAHGAGVEVAVGPAVHLAVEVACTEVTVEALDDAAIDAYVATGDPLDKAGAYGIQGPFGVHVTGLVGAFDNVVGLPLALTARMLADAGVAVTAPPEG